MRQGAATRQFMLKYVKLQVRLLQIVNVSLNKAPADVCLPRTSQQPARMIWHDHCEALLADCPEGIQPSAILKTRTSCRKGCMQQRPVHCCLYDVLHIEHAMFTCDRSYRTAGVDELKACNIYQMELSSFCCVTVSGAASEPDRINTGPVLGQQQLSTTALFGGLS